MKKYLSVFIGVFLVVGLANSIYTQMTKEPPSSAGKAKRLPCHMKLTTFERCYDKEALKKAQYILTTGNFDFNSYVEKSHYAPSKLFNYVKLKDCDNFMQKELSSYTTTKDKSKEKLHMTYYIYENDVKDPGKKTKKSKLYAGYVVFKVYDKNHKIIYQSQVDFMDRHGKDIKKSMKCVIKSFMTFNKTKGE